MNVCHLYRNPTTTTEAVIQLDGDWHTYRDGRVGEALRSGEATRRLTEWGYAV